MSPKSRQTEPGELLERKHPLPCSSGSPVALRTPIPQLRVHSSVGSQPRLHTQAQWGPELPVPMPRTALSLTQNRHRPLRSIGCSIALRTPTTQLSIQSSWGGSSACGVIARRCCLPLRGSRPHSPPSSPKPALDRHSSGSPIALKEPDSAIRYPLSRRGAKASGYAKRGRPRLDPSSPSR